MSLFTSLQLANNTLQAAQIGLQVVGNNIANVNTPGYIRQQAEFATAPIQMIGNLPLGLGVKVAGISQQLDKFLSQQLRSAASDAEGGKAKSEAYDQLEAILGELSDTDLSTSLVNFFSSIHDVLNQPEDTAIRNLAVLAGDALGQSFERLTSRVQAAGHDVNQRIAGIADEINFLTSDIARLNLAVTQIEAGEISDSDAIGLRDQREAALTQLASLTDIRVVEQAAGDVAVYSGGDYLVLGAEHREVVAAVTNDDGQRKVEIRIEATNKPLDASSGRLSGLTAARDEVFSGFVEQVDDLAQALIFEFNKIYSSGQGLQGYRSLTSEHVVDDSAAALDAAGLAFTPTNGSFQVQVINTETGESDLTDIFVQLNGFDDDATLDSLTASLNAVDGLNASINSSGHLELTSETSDVEFAFLNDTSGALAALGIGTFFTGTDARTLAVNDQARDPYTFAASGGGIGNDAQNAERLAGFLDLSLDSADGSNLSEIYDRIIADTSQGGAIAKAVADGFDGFKQTLEARHLGISGVSLDEEAVQMIQYQRMYQASARFIRTVSDLLDDLVNL